MKNVRVAKSAGFCFGVKRAVDMVYAQLETNDETKDGIKDPIYTYGPIIHNEEVVKDLEAKGVTVIHDISEIEESEKGTIVIIPWCRRKNISDIRKCRLPYRRCHLSFCKEDTSSCTGIWRCRLSCCNYRKCQPSGGRRNPWMGK